MGVKISQLVIRWILVLIPTVLIVYVTLTYLNISYTALNTKVGGQVFYFGTGLFIAYSLYFFRARWLVSFMVLWIGYFLAEKIIARLPGEFDVFYATARFQLYSTLFLCGWVFGLLLIRVKGAFIILFGILASVTIVVVSNTIDVSLEYILLHLVPVVAYVLYMLFLTPQLLENVEFDRKKSLRLAGRFFIFLILVILAFVLAETLFKENLKAVEKELAARGAKEKNEGDKEGGYDERYGLMEKRDDAYKMKDTMRIDSKMSQSDNLMFCSKLDNFFPDGSPMPLYYVYHYLTKYDPEKETFTRDAAVPFFDEFDADPSSLPLYSTRVSKTVIQNSLATKRRKVVSAEIYLASNTWKHSLLAPASAFSIQPIPVEKDFQKTFLTAYKVKSYTSDLNNAYFVYNPTAGPMLADYQQERIQELQTVSDYRRVDSSFYSYYTQMPSGNIYDSIKNLSRSIAGTLSTPVDKVIAVQNFFMQKGPNGKRIFKYTLKPGALNDPNIPTVSMLGNFLFKTHAGYCTYYAGASLLMLRSLGIPSRFTTGFATVNRSDKNKGWYWFYASQAHAWTQVYFPGYGWLDFDMTIGNEDQHSAPRPDGTPPLPPPEPWLVINSKVASAPDQRRKALEVSFSDLVFFNESYRLKGSVNKSVDASLCRVVYDKKDTTFSAIQAGDSVVLVSYKDDTRNIPAPKKGVPIEVQVSSFPTPLVVDEIHIKPKDQPKKESEKRSGKLKIEEKSIDWKAVFKTTAISILCLAALLLMLPTLILIFRFLSIRLAGDAVSKTNRIYRTALFRFHMAGIERDNETPLDYAITKVDPFFNAGFVEFMRIYLRLKYTNGTLSEGDIELIDQFDRQLGRAIRKKAKKFNLIANYFNPLLASRYFFRLEKTDYETQLQ